MVFHCEYCGASIDSEIDKNCPVCGASYAKNKSFKELKQKEEIRKKLEQEEKLNEAEAYKNEKTRIEKLTEFQNYLSSLTFFDPACGSGNFLTETYLSLGVEIASSSIVFTFSGIIISLKPVLLKAVRAMVSTVSGTVYLPVLPLGT